MVPTDPHEPTDEQKKNLMALMSSHGVALSRMKHKTTGVWRTIIMIATRSPKGGPMLTFPVGYMMEDGEVKSCLEDYEIPPGAVRETQQEYEARTGGGSDPTEELMDRVFPNRHKE